MEILKQLGVNETVWIQLGFFILSYFFLSTFVFKPYRRNLEFRKKNTSGSMEEATRLSAATEVLVMDYQGRMKSQNEKAQTIYNQLRNEALAEEEKLVAAARDRANKIIEDTRLKITREIEAGRRTLESQIPELSSLTASQVLGRDLQ